MCMHGEEQWECREGVGNTLAKNGRTQDYSACWHEPQPEEIRTFTVNLPLVPKSSKLCSAYIDFEKILRHVLKRDAVMSIQIW